MHDVNGMCALCWFPHSLYLQSPGPHTLFQRIEAFSLAMLKNSFEVLLRNVTSLGPQFDESWVTNSLERADKLHWKCPIFNWNCLVDLQIKCSQNFLVYEQMKAAKNTSLCENLTCWKWLSWFVLLYPWQLSRRIQNKFPMDWVLIEGPQLSREM